ncbi:2OG-Fe(II) oxygenase [Montanilutibacter psychrotolerans]|uniref:2OG-Fe(II) oxygenase n=1 Tax=Montanilutibacter psychrotolerans TaxID=1327343 RepID=A0A3M8T5J7_9GAMM|nr:2OG-Fe(II) oxygenase [Lysobacter psychrotolerans]RNF86470.1 2OG-Fe(II) oxygenase [Lysobacter psychrotolerans]
MPITTIASDPVLSNLRAAAAGGAPQALFELAAALVVRRHPEEAFDLYRRAAESGHSGAQFEHARMLLLGVGGDADPARGLDRMLSAERAGHAAAGYQLALIGLGGVLLPLDAQVNQRMLAAVQANYPPAVRAAALHFGRRAGDTNQTLCLQLLERAAQRGDVTAAQLLAQRLALGEGCQAQPAAADELLAQLDRHGVPRLPMIRVDRAQPSASDALPPGTFAFEDALQPASASVLSRQPRVARVDGLLSADECRLLVASARPQLRRSNAVDPESGLPIEVEVRTSSDASLDPVLEDFALRAVQLRMASAAGMAMVNGEHLTVLRYEPGQQYRPHRDYVPPGAIERDQPQAGNRQRTICVYLNDVEAGGETEFPVAGVRIAPRPGSAVVFDNLLADGRPDPDSLHAGLPVLAGEKWLATLWLRQRRYRGF